MSFTEKPRWHTTRIYAQPPLEANVSALIPRIAIGDFDIVIRDYNIVEHTNSIDAEIM
jgi:hypothetical protein